MSKVLFVGISLKVGGVERALLEQVNDLSETNDVTLFLFANTGGYIESLSKKVKLVSGNWLLNCIGRTKQESKVNLVVYLVRNFFAVLAKLFTRRFVLKIIFIFSRRFSGYDIAIAYVNDQSRCSLYGGANQYILSNVLARKKVAWIHSDPTRLDPISLNDYQEMDLVVSVSQFMKESFDEMNVIPSHKSICVYNRIDLNGIIAKSKALNPYVKNAFTILTVGRLEELKGTEELLEIIKQLVNDGYKFMWYFLGDGVLRSYCEEFIKTNDLENNVVLLGSKTNPYPYILNADLCVSGSKIETFGISIVEALALGTSVIALKYSAINEVLNNTNGVVCDTYNDIYMQLCQLFQSQSVDYISKPALLMDYNALNHQQMIEVLKL